MTENKFSLVDLGKLSKPISKLIEAVSQGIGTLYEPTKIRRRARAQADGALIKVEADIKKKELLHRAVNRFAFQEISRQENIENIIEIAAKSLPETVSEDPVDKDWISRFFEECKDVSNQELQKLWARLLAGEVASPGSCSRKTLTILKDLSQHDAELFSKICRLTWNTSRRYLFIPYNKKIGINSYFEKYEIHFGNLLHLDHYGLINSDQDVFVTLGYINQLNYFNFIHILKCLPESKPMPVFPLTSVGAEIFDVIKTEPNILYYDECIKMFYDHYNYSLSCLLPDNKEAS